MFTEKHTHTKKKHVLYCLVTTMNIVLMGLNLVAWFALRKEDAHYGLDMEHTHIDYACLPPARMGVEKHEQEEETASRSKGIPHHWPLSYVRRIASS
jgi:hypothetical protein